MVPRLEGTTPDQRTEIFARCKNRRASVCPSCSQLYAGDTWQLVHAGIVGEDERTLLDGRPMVFVTLTAPSFGAVHGTVLGTTSGSLGLCRPGRQGLLCRHGRSSGSGIAHVFGDALVGAPLCPECYDYLGHVLLTWHAPALWHRFTGGKDGTLWYYRSMVNALREVGPAPLVEELDREVTEIEQLTAENSSS